MEKKQFKAKDMLVIGAALFAMFFGAGNLIFPPLLGQQTGTSWLIGFLFFFIFDVGLALVAILALISKNQYSITGLTGPMGKVPSAVIGAIGALCIGPFLAIPRTAATTYEVGVAPLLTNAPGFATWIFSAFFFAVVLVLTIRPSKVVDIVGQFLTPILVIFLLIMIIVGIVNPLGPIETEATVNAVREGTYNGYQTLDVIASMIFIIIIANSARDKGYNDQSSLAGATIRSSVVAAVGLLVIYGGLTYLGATTGTLADYQGLDQTTLLVTITKGLFGNIGVILLGIIVLFACWTTAIGLTSAVSEYFVELSDGKLKYKTLVIAIVVFSWVVSNAGVATIIKVSAPLLNLIYPGLLVLIILAFFHKQIKNNNIYRFAAYFGMITSALEILAGFDLPTDFVSVLPLADMGFAWIIPAIVGGIIGKFIPSKS